jgi:hypothetical protein
MAKVSVSYTIVRIDDGVGIASQVFSYMATETGEVPSETSVFWTDWQTAYAEFGESKRFFWQKDTITYTDGTTQTVIVNFNIYSSGEVVIIQYCYGDDTEPFDADYLIGTDTYVIGDSECVIGTNIWTDEELPQVAGKYIWRREGKYNPDTDLFPTSWVVTRLTGDAGESGAPAEVIDLTLSSQTYAQNLRISNGLTDVKAKVSLQGSYTAGTLSVFYDNNGTQTSLAYITKVNSTAKNPAVSSVSVVDGDVVTISIPNTYSNPVSISLSSLIPAGLITKVCNPIDETEYDHDFGIVTNVPASYLDEHGRTCGLLDGDYFVAGCDFEGDTSATVVTPQSGDNPKELHWDERTGSGTSQDPYVYTETTDTTVTSGKTYYTVKYKKGVPFIYSSSAWATMTATAPNASRMLNALANVLTDPTVQPSIGALYAWIENLTVLNAVVDNLVAKKLKVGLGDASSGFFLKIEDGDPPIIICKFNGSILWEINASTGKMYGNFALVRQFMPFQFDDSLDDTYPMECDFYIPSNAEIVSIKLSSKGKNYRAYSKSAATSGGTKTSSVIDPDWAGARGSFGITVTKTGNYSTVQTESAGDHKHTYDKATGTGSGFSADGAHSHNLSFPYSDNKYTGYSNPDNHRHSYIAPTSTESNSGAHSHSIQTTSTNTSETGSHKHGLPAGIVTDVTFSGSGLASTSLTLSNSQIEHGHIVDISHDHSLTFGIYESTKPAGVELFCSNNGSTYGSAISGASATGDNSNFDITQQFSGTGWKSIKFTSTQLGRIQAQLIIELLVTT